MIAIVRRVAVMSVLVVAGTLLWFRRVDAPRPWSRIATIPVVVATRDIPEGVAIDRVAVQVAQWPVGTQPAGAYSTIDSVSNRVTRVAVYKGEAIIPGRLAPEGTRPAPIIMPAPLPRTRLFVEAAPL